MEITTPCRAKWSPQCHRTATVVGPGSRIIDDRLPLLVKNGWWVLGTGKTGDHIRTYCPACKPLVEEHGEPE